LFRYRRAQIRLEYHCTVVRHPAPPFAEFHTLTHGCGDPAVPRSPKYDLALF
jgi:hypothetical protein